MRTLCLFVAFLPFALASCSKSPAPSEPPRPSESVRLSYISGPNWFGCRDRGKTEELTRYAGDQNRSAFIDSLSRATVDGLCTRFKSNEAVLVSGTALSSGLVQARRQDEAIFWWTQEGAIRSAPPRQQAVIWGAVKSIMVNSTAVNPGDTEADVDTKMGFPFRFETPLDEGIRVETATETLYGIRIVNYYFLENKWFRITLQRKVPYRPYVVKWKGYNDRGVLVVSKIEVGIAEKPEAPAPFKVAAQYETNLALVVPKETSNGQLRTLVFTLQKARRENRLGQLLPPTTPGGSRGPYGVVNVYVYTEPNWATAAMLEKCVNGLGGTALDVECGRHIRAYYSSNWIGTELGGVGWADEHVRTKDYEELFNVP